MPLLLGGGIGELALKEKKIWVDDTIENLGNKPQPFMLLYHINMGAPFLRPGTKVFLPQSSIQTFDPVAESHKACSALVPDVSEEGLDLLWLHHPEKSYDMHAAMVDNGNRQIRIAWSADTLPILGQWMLLQPKDYVLALEPTNTHLQGQDWESANGILQYLNPGETRHAELEFSF